MKASNQQDIWRPHVTVAAVAEQNGRFLLVEELVAGQAVYNQPAGHLEPHESLVSAVIRETMEESAWHFTPSALIGVYCYTSARSGTSYQRFCFTGHCEQQEIGRKLDKDILRVHWLTRDEIAAQSTKLRSPMVLRCIDDYLNGNRYPLSLIIEVPPTK